MLSDCGISSFSSHMITLISFSPCSTSLSTANSRQHKAGNAAKVETYQDELDDAQKAFESMQACHTRKEKKYFKKKKCRFPDCHMRGLSAFLINLTGLVCFPDRSHWGCLPSSPQCVCFLAFCKFGRFVRFPNRPHCACLPFSS